MGIERFGELLGVTVGFAWGSLPNLRACPMIGFIPPNSVPKCLWTRAAQTWPRCAHEHGRTKPGVAGPVQRHA